MISARIPHALGAAVARQKLDGFFQSKQMACAWNSDAHVAIVSKSLPFVGEAEAEVKVHDDSVEVHVTKAPAFPPADTIQRLIVDELTRVFA